MNKSDEDKTLREVGERHIVQRILDTLSRPPMLLDGFGHDGAFLDLPLKDGEILVVNTDRSGLNLAYQLGLAAADCVGDLGVSHAISDIVAAGGLPKAVTVALLLPPETKLGFVLEVMNGAERAAARYGAIIAGGDTKQNPKFAMVVTAIGTARRERRLRRSSARPGDALVVTGHLGSMLLGSIALKQAMVCPDRVRSVLEDALINQHPPFDLGQALADKCIANACIDISDGLGGALFSLCAASGVGALIDEDRLPIHTDLLDLASTLGLRPMQLALAGGDWQFLYALPQTELAHAERLARSTGTPLTAVGRVIEADAVAVRTTEGRYCYLKRIEHDSFADQPGGTAYFEMLTTPQQCFGDQLSGEQFAHLMKPDCLSVLDSHY